MKAYVNGKIYTVNEKRDWAEAVVIDGSKIAYVGDDDIPIFIYGTTISNAYQMRMEDKIGSIEEGKYADLVILDSNVFERPIEEVYKTQVCETIMNGKTTYKA